jgi:uncharacterized radical SAM protein YgiQ
VEGTHGVKEGLGISGLTPLEAPRYHGFMGKGKTKKNAPFLPTTREEMEALGWEELDVLLVTGDAYVDHPSFGAALIGRYLESLGYKVGILPQPDWRHPEAFLAMGTPRLFVGVTSGAMDSMVSHYTSLGKPRREDHYTEGGKAGARPDRALLVYANRVREAMPGVPIVLGGVEASLRRLSHYDFWSNKIRKSVLIDSKATILVYGMGERAVGEICRRLEEGEDLEGIPGTAMYFGKKSFGGRSYEGALWLPDHEFIEESPEALLQMTLLLERESQPWMRKTILQRAAGKTLVIFPPSEPLTEAELDSIYSLPFSRKPHPRYRGEIPAHTMIRDSITIVRGCAGGCSFCSIGLHQGRAIQSRSVDSVKEEAMRMACSGDFRGTISDLGGPTANMYGLSCTSGHRSRRCKRVSCLFPDICPCLSTDHGRFSSLLEEVRRLPGVRHVFVSSGIRHDLALKDRDFLEQLVKHHVSGHLKVAPEHASQEVLALMRKPSWDKFLEFQEIFSDICRRERKRFFLVPYLMAGFPGCTIQQMDLLAQRLKASGLKPRQVQLFLPTPMTLATAMYLAERDSKGRKIFVAKSHGQRLEQWKRLFYWKQSGGQSQASQRCLP